MQVRDAVEDDAAAMAAIADAPQDVMRNLVHDRTVRVAEPDIVDADPNADAAGTDPQLLGFVSFDAKQDAVHVTQLDGTDDACELLLSEPIRFAERERMIVELLVPEANDGVAAAARSQGFDDVGSGPRFEGVQTTRYRLEP
ncbi:hypothetical protein [Salinarchaeum laminariae]|uniref:hypothetical protein n=1 Tax=Salinarchaeum laminariae TaxID=869888 RepID=UPI0020BD9169|nr:hypothetical protein [Salinarchaeum laminariae]